MLTPDEIVELTDRLARQHPHDLDVLAMCAELMRRVVATRLTLTATRPWAAEGVSRATWYRRRA